MSNETMERILASPKLPSMPMVVMKVLELVDRENVTAKEIASTIQQDPALAAKLLQAANSPFFGVTREIGSIQQAAVVLGLRAVKVMALSFWLVDDAQQSAGGDFDYRLYWRRSLTSAAVASLLSAHIPDVRADECFVAGLLADLGMLAAYHCVEDRYRPVLEQYATCSRPVQEIEAEVLGFTHARISAELLRRWSLPELLCDAIAAHHGEGAELLDAPAQSLAKALHASACIAELFCGDVEGTRLDEVKALCRELLSVPSEALETILEEVEQNVAEMASLFNVEIGEALSYDAIRRKAMVKMVNISMSAEMERVQAHKHAEQVRKELERVSREAATDGLTQLANRRAFDGALERTLAEASAGGCAVGLILIDVDHFKALNDTHGHTLGDEALRLVGRTLRSLGADGMMPARYGGEEFAIIVADVTESSLRRITERIRRTIEETPLSHDGRVIPFTASLGAFHVDMTACNPTPLELIQRADRCLYEAKEGGRNRVVVARAEPTRA